MIVIAELLIFFSTLYNVNYFVLCQGGGWEVGQAQINSMSVSVNISVIAIVIFILITLIKRKTFKAIKLYAVIIYALQGLSTIVVLVFAHKNNVVDALRLGTEDARKVVLNFGFLGYLICIIMLVLVLIGLKSSRMKEKN